MTIERKVLTDLDRLRIAEEDHAGLVALVRAAIPVAEASNAHVSDIAATLAVLMPGIAARVSILKAGGQAEVAQRLVADALAALKVDDPILFEPCSKTAYVEIASKFSARSIALGTADRGGPEELRRSAYQLRWKAHGGEGAREPIQETRRRNALGHEQILVGDNPTSYHWDATDNG